MPDVATTRYDLGAARWHATGDFEAARKAFAAALARHGVKVTVQKSVAEDIGVADDILSRLTDSGADLLVMGAHGHKFFKDLIFGTTVDTVRHRVGIPVLIVKEK